VSHPLPSANLYILSIPSASKKTTIGTVEYRASALSQIESKTLPTGTEKNWASICD